MKYRNILYGSESINILKEKYVHTVMYPFVFHYSAKVIDQNESKLSKVKDDLVNTKEQLNQTVLSKEVLEQEKREVGK